jgi:hypothetical protein
MNLKRILEELEFIENSAAKDNYIAGAIHNHATNIRNYLLSQDKDLTNALLVATDRMETLLKIEKSIEELKNKPIRSEGKDES